MSELTPFSAFNPFNELSKDLNETVQFATMLNASLRASMREVHAMMMENLSLRKQLAEVMAERDGLLENRRLGGT